MNDPYPKHYPELQQDGGDRAAGESLNFRLSKSDEVLKGLEGEVKHYEGVRKKYNRARGIITKISIGTGTLSAILSASGLGTSLTGFGIVVGVPLGALGGVFAVTSVACASVSKRLSGKVSKHEQTVALAKAKVNTIQDLVSKALKDQKISDDEFSLILADVKMTFEDLKLSIRQKTRAVEQQKKKRTFKVYELKLLSAQPNAPTPLER